MYLKKCTNQDVQSPIYNKADGLQSADIDLLLKSPHDVKEFAHCDGYYDLPLNQGQHPSKF